MQRETLDIGTNESLKKAVHRKQEDAKNVNKMLFRGK